MTDSLKYRSMTSDEAFAILQGLFDIAVVNYEAVPTDEITLNTRIHDMYWLGDDMSFGASGKAGVLEPLFGIKVPMREWRKAISPGRKKTVADLCNFLAAHALVPVIPTPSILGRPCRAAGAFFTVRQMLENTGAITSDLAPSSSLADFSNVGIPKIWNELIKLAPCLLGRIRWEGHWDLPFALLAILFIFSTIVGGVVAGNVPTLGLPWAIASLAAFVLTWQFSEKRAALPKRVVFEGLTTIRDLCKVLASQERELRHQQV